MFSDNDFFFVLAVSVNLDDLDNLYREDDRNDIYYIALQLLMENFAQFLSANDGIGTIYLETTDAVNNKRLQNLFHLLKATGTLFVKKEVLQERLSTINSLDKGVENDIILIRKRKCIAIRLTYKRKELHSFSFFCLKLSFLHIIITQVNLIYFCLGLQRIALYNFAIRFLIHHYFYGRRQRI